MRVVGSSRIDSRPRTVGKPAKSVSGKARTTGRCARARRRRGPTCGDPTRERDVSASAQSRSCAHLHGRIPKGAPAPRFGAHTWRGFVTPHGADSRRVFSRELVGRDTRPPLQRSPNKCGANARRSGTSFPPGRRCPRSRRSSCRGRDRQSLTGRRRTLGV